MRGAAILGGLAPLLAVLLIPPPAGLPAPAWAAVGLGLLMAIWWMTEAVPLAVTALLPIALWPFLTGADLASLSGAYAHPLIFLFLGGFMLARAIQGCGLDRRIANAALAAVGRGRPAVLAAIMGTTAFLSLWISNTAAAMVMAPIAAAVAGAAAEEDMFTGVLMLGVAFSATIGGLGSLIGTPPNAVFAAYMSEAHGLRFGFAEWALVGMPVAVVLLGAAWVVLIGFVPAGQRHRVAGEIVALDRMSAAERRVGSVACLTALAWLGRPLIDLWLGTGVVTDAGIAVFAAVSLFVLPDGAMGRLLTWDSAALIRWDILLLFGGGLALAQIIDQTGLAGWIGERSRGLAGVPVWIVIAIFAAGVILLGELASNTAMAAILLPIAGAMAHTLSVDPVLFTIPIALAASIGFMLPVATPPNAIVLGYPGVTRAGMLAAGAPLDLIGMILAAGLGGLLAQIVF